MSAYRPSLLLSYGSKIMTGLKQRCKNVPTCQQCWCKKIFSQVKSLPTLCCFVEKVSNVAISLFLANTPGNVVFYVGFFCNFMLLFRLVCTFFGLFFGLLCSFVENNFFSSVIYALFLGKTILAPKWLV